MMKQYHAIRRELPPHTLLLFRLGDFYEMFGDDAREASAILNVALTKRGEIPMCGVPYHSARGYIEKLIAAGWRAAICDQVGEVQAGKLVRREVSQILSAGTLDDFGLDDRRPNYLAAVCQGNGSIGLAYCELTTGEFRLTELPGVTLLVDELARILPAETIAPESQRELFDGLANANFLDGYIFETLAAAGVPARAFQGSFARWLRVYGLACGGWRGGSAFALSHPADAKKRLASPPAPTIPLERVSDARCHNASASRTRPVSRR